MARQSSAFLGLHRHQFPAGRMITRSQSCNTQPSLQRTTTVDTELGSWKELAIGKSTMRYVRLVLKRLSVNVTAKVLSLRTKAVPGGKFVACLLIV